MKEGKMDVMEAIRTRRSVRAYKRDPIPQDVLGEVLEAFRLAPSANNEQPWKLIVVSERDLRQKIASACWNQTFIAEAPCVLVACGLPNRSRIGGYTSSLLVDVAIALDHLTLSARSFGLGTCWIGAFEQDTIKKLLDIPAEVRVVAVMPLGYPAYEDGAPRRKPIEEVVCRERFTA